MGPREQAVETKREVLPSTQGNRSDSNWKMTEERVNNCAYSGFQACCIQLQITALTEWWHSEPNNPSCHCEILWQIHITAMPKVDIKHTSNTKEGISKIASKNRWCGFTHLKMWWNKMYFSWIHIIPNITVFTTLVINTGDRYKQENVVWYHFEYIACGKIWEKWNYMLKYNFLVLISAEVPQTTNTMYHYHSVPSLRLKRQFWKPVLWPSADH